MYMKRELNLVKAFHIKFDSGVSEKPTLIPEDRSTHRYRMMKDEVEEYLKGVEQGDLVNIAKELADILYTVYGTIIEHGLEDKIEDIFAEVHRSNMSKDYHEYKMVKGEGYVKANVKQFFD